MSIKAMITRTAAVTAGAAAIIGLGLTGAASAATAAPAGNPTVGPQTCSIQTTNGHYLTAVGGGGLSSGDTLHTDATRVGSWETFRVTCGL